MPISFSLAVDGAMSTASAFLGGTSHMMNLIRPTRRDVFKDFGVLSFVAPAILLPQPPLKSDIALEEAVRRFEVTLAAANIACSAADDVRTRIHEDIGPEPRMFGFMSEAGRLIQREKIDAWRDRFAELREIYGLDALERIEEARLDDYDAAKLAVEATPALTLRGLQLKAQHAAEHEGFGESLIRDLRALA